jgi:putative DNA primase/helicase
MSRLLAAHAAKLESLAIKLEIAERAGVHSAVAVNDLPDALRWLARHEGALPAIVFPQRPPRGGATIPRVRVAQPVELEDGKTAKYLTPSGVTPTVNVHPDMADRVADPAMPIVIVEGSQQYLAVVSALDGQPVAAAGIAGCYGWCHNGQQPVPDMHDIPWENRVVTTLFDGDIARNPHVWDAAVGLAKHLEIEGAETVRHVVLPVSGTNGIDDFLGSKPPERRTKVLLRLLERPGQLPKRRPGRSKKPFFSDEGRLRTETLADAVRERAPLALEPSGKIAIYGGGVYQSRPDDGHVVAIIADLLREDYWAGYRSTVTEFLVGRLTAEGLIIPDQATDPVLNVANGMLDLRTSQLTPHSPEHLSNIQIPVPWDPDATCPTYSEWIHEQLPDQADELDELISLELDPSTTPQKAGFPFGPPRSGKSTIARLAQAVAGKPNSSSVTLHQMAENRFLAAQLYGKLLNTAPDLESRHVDNVALFKRLTGEDSITAEHKFGHPFTFTNTALILFTANTVPTVGEQSTAFLERIVPLEFSRSFAGREDPSIEAKMMTELPGILARWVRAWQRRNIRGGFAPNDPAVKAKFERSTNRVRMWIDDDMTIVREHPGAKTGGPVAVTDGQLLPPSECTTKTDLHRAFNDWSEETHSGRMSRNVFSDLLTSINGVVEVRRADTKARALNIRSRRESDPDPAERWQSGNSPTDSRTSNSENDQVDEKPGRGSRGETATLPPGAAHIWCPCDQCGQEVLLYPGPRHSGKWVWPACRLTPGCTGRHTDPRHHGDDNPGQRANPGELGPIDPDNTKDPWF